MHICTLQGLHRRTPDTTCEKGSTYSRSHYHLTCCQNQSPNSMRPTTTPGALSSTPYLSIRTYGMLLMDPNLVPPAMPIQRPFGLMRKSTLMSGKEDLLRSARACAKYTLHVDLPRGSWYVGTFLQWWSLTAKWCSNGLPQSNTSLITFTNQASPLMLKQLNHSKSESRPEKRKPLSSSSPATSDIHMGKLLLLSMPLCLTNSPLITVCHCLPSQWGAVPNLTWLHSCPWDLSWSTCP